MCVLDCHPIYSGSQVVCGRTSRVVQEEGHTGFLHLPSAVLALIFLARRIQPFLSLVDREVEFYVLLLLGFVLYYYYLFIFVRKNLSSCDDTEIRTHVPTSDGFEVTN